MPFRCPSCRRACPETDEARPFRPFCSERCRLADLGRWLSGDYRITAPLSEEDLDQGLPGSEGSTGTGDRGSSEN